MLLKVHQVIYRAVRERAGDCDFLVPNDIPTNLVLGVTDVLVTDYSSIFFDYLSTGRPVLHFVPDLDDYRTGRGLYLTEKQLPGPVSATVPELVGDLEEALSGPERSPRTEAAAATYAPRDDGSCARASSTWCSAVPTSPGTRCVATSAPRRSGCSSTWAP